MAKKRQKRQKKAVGAKKVASKKKVVRKKKVATRGRAAVKSNAANKKMAARTKTAGNERKAALRNKAARRERLSRGVRSSGNDIAVMRKGPGSGSAGQSGDIQGLSDVETADSESVRELVEDGQDYEAGIVDGVENAPDADQGEVKTREVPQDDVILDKIPGKRNTL
ncbi:MAG: response regulator [Candidatus Acidiferrales bacterium]